MNTFLYLHNDGTPKLHIGLSDTICVSGGSVWKFAVDNDGTIRATSIGKATK